MLASAIVGQTSLGGFCEVQPSTAACGAWWYYIGTQMVHYQICRLRRAALYRGSIFFGCPVALQSVARCCAAGL